MEEIIMNKPLIAIPIGDPAGVGPEITAMALAAVSYTHLDVYKRQYQF